ncbi:toxin glutamine deamidase domain-containing protein, partial [Streptomyces broussonetiae]|uniref:toxin glutamine deamidase domain-containing protein n=1 Tax=Streptomyces broussonetiae TaxID=2686304 RepID=UPI0035DD88F2
MQEEPWYNQFVVFLSGMNVPLGSSERIYQEFVLPHRQKVRDLGEVKSNVVGVANGTLTGANGQWPAAYVKLAADFVSGGGADYIQALQDGASNLADAAMEFAYQIDYTNAMIVGQVVVFLFEWALTLVMAIFDPVGALAEQAALQRIFGEFFKLALTRFLLQAGIIMSVSVGLAAALDGLVRFALGLQGKHTTQGSTYQHQSLVFGAIQGAIGAFVPFATEPIAKLVNKAFNPLIADSIRESIERALHGPTGAMRNLAGDAVSGAGKDVTADAVRGVVRGADGEVVPPPLSVFGRDLADEVAGFTSSMNVGVDLNMREGFIARIGNLFEQAFGDSARAAGQQWALAYTKYVGKPGLQRELYNALDGLPDRMGREQLRLALSRGVVRGLDFATVGKFARLLAESPVNAAHQNVSEGFFNTLTTGRFTTSFATGISGAGGGIVSGVLHMNAVHLGNQIKASLFAKPPQLDLNPADVNGGVPGGGALTGKPDSGGSPGGDRPSKEPGEGGNAGPYPSLPPDAHDWGESTGTLVNDYDLDGQWQAPAPPPRVATTGHGPDGAETDVPTVAAGPYPGRTQGAAGGAGPVRTVADGSPQVPSGGSAGRPPAVAGAGPVPRWDGIATALRDLHLPDVPRELVGPDGTRTVLPETAGQIRTAMRGLDELARDAGMPPARRDAYVRAVQEAAETGNWAQAAENIQQFHLSVDALVSGGQIAETGVHVTVGAAQEHESPETAHDSELMRLRSAAGPRPGQGDLKDLADASVAVPQRAADRSLTTTSVPSRSDAQETEPVGAAAVLSDGGTQSVGYSLSEVAAGKRPLTVSDDVSESSTGRSEDEIASDLAAYIESKKALHAAEAAHRDAEARWERQGEGTSQGPSELHATKAALEVADDGFQRARTALTDAWESLRGTLEISRTDLLTRPRIVGGGVGFEFEEGDWRVWQRVKSDKMSSLRSLRGVLNVLDKDEVVPAARKSVLHSGSYFKLEADTNTAKKYAELEFVTDPFDETDSGAQRLDVAVNELKDIDRRLSALAGMPGPAELGVKDRHPLSVRDYKNNYVRHMDHGFEGSPGWDAKDVLLSGGLADGIRVKMQATFGISLETLPKVMERMGRDVPGETPQQSRERQQVRRIFYPEGLPNEALSMQGRVPTLARNLVSSLRTETAYAKALRGNTGQLAGFLSAVLLTMKQLQRPAGTGVTVKSRLSLMPRNDFAQMFASLPTIQQNAMRAAPDIVIRHLLHISNANPLFGKGGWDGQLSVDSSLIRPNPGPLRQGRTGGLERGPGSAVDTALAKLTIGDWMRGITQGRDYLNAANMQHFLGGAGLSPQVKDEVAFLMRSIGEMPSPDMREEGELLFVFEIRMVAPEGPGESLPIADAGRYAKDILRFFQRIRTEGPGAKSAEISTERTGARSKASSSATRYPVVGMALTQSETTDALNNKLLAENLESVLRARVHQQTELGPTISQNQAGPDMARELQPRMQPMRVDVFGGDLFAVARAEHPDVITEDDSRQPVVNDSDTFGADESISGDTLVDLKDDKGVSDGAAKVARAGRLPQSREEIARWIDSLPAAGRGANDPAPPHAKLPALRPAEDVTVAMFTGADEHQRPKDDTPDVVSTDTPLPQPAQEPDGPAEASAGSVRSPFGSFAWGQTVGPHESVSPMPRPYDWGQTVGPHESVSPVSGPGPFSALGNAGPSGLRRADDSGAPVETASGFGGSYNGWNPDLDEPKKIGGISAKNSDSFRKLSRDLNVFIVAREVNEYATQRRAEGALPKPLEVKAKTLNKYDLILADGLFSEEDLGLVVLYSPTKLPDDLSAYSKEDQEKIRARYTMRQAEFIKYSAEMNKDPFSIVDGIVHLGEEKITSDIDLYDLYTPTRGTQLSPQSLNFAMKEIRREVTDVQHDPAMYWKDRTPADDVIFNGITRHIESGHEPVVTYGPGRRPTFEGQYSRKKSIAPIPGEDLFRPWAESPDSRNITAVSAPADGEQRIIHPLVDPYAGPVRVPPRQISDSGKGKGRADTRQDGPRQREASPAPAADGLIRTETGKPYDHRNPGAAAPRGELRSEAALKALADATVAAVAAETGMKEAALAQPRLLNCVTLLEGLKRQLYPAHDLSAGTAGRTFPSSAVRAATTLDDLSTGDTGTERRLVQGPGWGPVTSWEALANAVTDAGPGATGLVVVRRSRGPGHAFALHHTTDGIRWVDLQAPQSERVTLEPRMGQPLHTRAVVIDGGGRVLEHAMDSQRQNPSRSVDALTHPPADPELIGAIGFEVEDGHPLWAREGVVLAVKMVLAEHRSGGRLEIDREMFQRGRDGRLYDTAEQAAAVTGDPGTLVNVPIIEFVSPPMAVIPGEAHSTSVAEGLRRFRAFRDLLRVTDSTQRSVSLEQILARDPGWTLTDTGREVFVLPSSSGPDHAAYTQFTVGVPVGGLKSILHVAEERMDYPFLAPLMAAGRQFGERVAAHYASVLIGRDVLPQQVSFLTELAGVDEIYGYSWLVFQHVAGRVIWNFFTETERTLTKNILVAASRHPFHVLHQGLTASTRNHLDAHIQQVDHIFRDELQSLIVEHQRMWWGERQGEPGITTHPAMNLTAHRAMNEVGIYGTVGDFLDYAMLGQTGDGRSLSQEQLFGIVDYPHLDTRPDRNTLPLALLELRDVSSDLTTRVPQRRANRMRDEVVESAAQQMTKAAQHAYRQAARFVGRRGIDARAARSVLDDPAVQATADAFTMIGDVRTSDSSGRLLVPALAPVDRAALGAAVARHVTGTPLPPALFLDLRDAEHRLHSTLTSGIRLSPQDTASLNQAREAVRQMRQHLESTQQRDQAQAQAYTQGPVHVRTHNPGQVYRQGYGASGSQYYGSGQWGQAGSGPAGGSYGAGRWGEPVPGVDAAVRTGDGRGFGASVDLTHAGEVSRAVRTARGLIDVPDGVERPVAVRAEAARLLSLLLHDPALARRFEDSGARVVVIPRNQSLGDLMRSSGYPRAGEETSLREDARGWTFPGLRLAAVSEENLLGQGTGPHGHAHPEGYSSALHEYAHLFYLFALAESHRAAVSALYRVHRAEGPAARWVDGPLTTSDGRFTGNHASSSVEEYFAQSVVAYVGANHGRDHHTGQTRNNGAAWIEAHDPGMHGILRDVLGAPPAESLDANALSVTDHDDALWTALADHTALSQTTDVPRRVHFADGSKPGMATERPALTIETQLDRHRPARIVRSRPAPPRNGRRVTFSDGSELPTYLTGDGNPDTQSGAYGHARVTLRNPDDVVEEIASRAGLSRTDGEPSQAGMLDALLNVLQSTPWVFHGEGYRTPTFLDRHGRPRALHITTRPHDKWDKFKDDFGSPLKFDSVQRSQFSVGTSAMQSSTLRAFPSVAIGPVAGDLTALGRIGAGLGLMKSFDYAMHDQTLQQSETRSLDRSHVHLADVHYDVHVVSPEHRSTGELFPGESHFSFTMLSGLTVRLPENVTSPVLGTRAPHHLRFDTKADMRLVRSEDFGAVGPIRDWALSKIDAAAGDPAYEEVAQFFRRENFRLIAQRAAMGPVPTNLLRGERGGRPLGAFLVDRIVPVEGLLLNETLDVEMRHSTQQGIRNEQVLARAYSQMLYGSVGPSSDFVPFFGSPYGVRVLAALYVKYGRSNSYADAFGGTANRKIVGQLKKVPTDLYLVLKDVYVRYTGDAVPQRFRVWSLDRIPRSEARRLAGWDDGRTRTLGEGKAPAPPVYLKRDHPIVLGMSRTEAFAADSTHTDATRDVSGPPTARETEAGVPQPDLLQDFAQHVIEAAHARYPDMIAPFRELGVPAEPHWWQKALRQAESYDLRLQNTLTVIKALSFYAMAGNLETLSTTGLRIPLVAPGPGPAGSISRAHRYLLVSAELTDLRYEGVQDDLIVRSGTTATERLDGSQNVVRSGEVGFDVSAGGRDVHRDQLKIPQHILYLGGGPRKGVSQGKRSGYGSTASYETQHIGTSTSQLYSYRISLRAQIGGYWRFRSLLRGTLTLGLLGTHHFVFHEPLTDLVGGTAGGAVTGRVTLSVADEHTNSYDPKSRLGVREEVVTSPLTRDRAKALTTGTEFNYPANTFGNYPYHVLGVGAHAELIEAAAAALRDASHGSWHVSEPGAPAYESALRPLQPQYLTANFDQFTSTQGLSVNGLFGQGPYFNRRGFVVHRSHLRKPLVISAPVEVQIEQTLGADTQTSGAVTDIHSFTWGGAVSYGQTHNVGPGIYGTYGGLISQATSSLNSVTTTQTALADVNAVMSGPHVLLAANMHHEIAAHVNADGLLKPVHTLATAHRAHWAGRRVYMPDSWYGHVSEKTAHLLHLMADNLGRVPKYDELPWKPLLAGDPLGTYAVNSLDTAKILSEFERKLRAAGVGTTSRDRVRSLLSPRAIRALLDQMSLTGKPTRVRTGMSKMRLSRTETVTIRLIPGETRFDGLGHGTVVKDGRHSTRTVEKASGKIKSWLVAGLASEYARTGNDLFKTSGPSVIEQGTSVHQSTNSSTAATFANNIVILDEPHTDQLTSYRLEITYHPGGGKEQIRLSDEVGSLRSLVPVSLSVPAMEHPVGPDHPLGIPRLPASERAVTFWPTHEITREKIDQWRGRGLPDGRPFAHPEVGYTPRRVTGLETIKEAAELAISRAYGTNLGLHAGQIMADDDLNQLLANAREEGLTRTGTASSFALSEGLSNTSLTAFYADTAGRLGYQVPGLTDDAMAGSTSGAFHLYSRPDFTGAELLSVAPVISMENGFRDSRGGDSSLSISQILQVILSGGTRISSADVPREQPVFSPADGSGTEGEGSRQVDANATQITIKPTVGRGFLFAVPTAWLAVAEVHHQIKDSKLGQWFSRQLGSFGHVNPGPQAVETESHVVAWLSEDIARRHGLITDENFPPQVAEAWAQVHQAGKAWQAADKAYWDQRRVWQPRQERLVAAYSTSHHALTDAKRAMETAVDRYGPTSRQALNARDAIKRATESHHAARAALNEAPALLRRWHVAAVDLAAEYHRVRAAADALTRWYRLPRADSAQDPQAPRQGVHMPPAVTFRQPDPVEPPRTPPAPDRFGDVTTDDGVQTLTPPPTVGGRPWSGAGQYTVHDTPYDDSSFFHAIAETLHHAAPSELSGGDLAGDRDATVETLRSLFAHALTTRDSSALVEHLDSESFGVVTPEEIAQAGIRFQEGSPEHREFTETRRIPLYHRLSLEQRASLAAVLLHRTGSRRNDTAWQASAAELLPSLAARALGARVTVVGRDGLVKEFGADDTQTDKPHVVLWKTAHHFRVALPVGVQPSADVASAARPDALAPTEPDPEQVVAPPPEDLPPGSRGPALGALHDAAPWNTHPLGGAGFTRRDTTLLVGPDGAEYRLEEPRDDSNGFWHAFEKAFGRDDRDGDLVNRVVGQRLPDDAVLDPETPFTHEILLWARVDSTNRQPTEGIRAGRLTGAQREEFRTSGGRLPHDVVLSARQRRDLIKAQLFLGNEWNEATVATAAQVAAKSYGTEVVVVREDGTHETYRAAEPGRDRRVTLFRRGSEFLLARPQQPASAATSGSGASSMPEQAPHGTHITRQDPAHFRQEPPSRSADAPEPEIDTVDVRAVHEATGADPTRPTIDEALAALVAAGGEPAATPAAARDDVAHTDPVAVPALRHGTPIRPSDDSVMGGGAQNNGGGEPQTAGDHGPIADAAASWAESLGAMSDDERTVEVDLTDPEGRRAIFDSPEIEERLASSLTPAQFESFARYLGGAVLADQLLAGVLGPETLTVEQRGLIREAPHHLFRLEEGLDADGYTVLRALLTADNLASKPESERRLFAARLSPLERRQLTGDDVFLTELSKQLPAASFDGFREDLHRESAPSESESDSSDTDDESETLHFAPEASRRSVPDRHGHSGDSAGEIAEPSRVAAAPGDRQPKAGTGAVDRTRLDDATAQEALDGDPAGPRDKGKGRATPEPDIAAPEVDEAEVQSARDELVAARLELDEAIAARAAQEPRRATAQGMPSSSAESAMASVRGRLERASRRLAAAEDAWRTLLPDTPLPWVEDTDEPGEGQPGAAPGQVPRWMHLLVEDGDALAAEYGAALATETFSPDTGYSVRDLFVARQLHGGTFESDVRARRVQEARLDAVRRAAAEDADDPAAQQDALDRLQLSLAHDSDLVEVMRSLEQWSRLEVAEIAHRVAAVRSSWSGEEPARAPAQVSGTHMDETVVPPTQGLGAGPSRHVGLQGLVVPAVRKLRAVRDYARSNGISGEVLARSARGRLNGGAEFEDGIATLVEDVRSGRMSTSEAVKSAYKLVMLAMGQDVSHVTVIPEEMARDSVMLEVALEHICEHGSASGVLADNRKRLKDETRLVPSALNNWVREVRKGRREIYAPTKAILLSLQIIKPKHEVSVSYPDGWRVDGPAVGEAASVVDGEVERILRLLTGDLRADGGVTVGTKTEEDVLMLRALLEFVTERGSFEGITGDHRNSLKDFTSLSCQLGTWINNVRMGYRLIHAVTKEILEIFEVLGPNYKNVRVHSEGGGLESDTDADLVADSLTRQVNAYLQGIGEPVLSVEEEQQVRDAVGAGQVMSSDIAAVEVIFARGQAAREAAMPFGSDSLAGDDAVRAEAFLGDRAGWDRSGAAASLVDQVNEHLQSVELRVLSAEEEQQVRDAVGAGQVMSSDIAAVEVIAARGQAARDAEGTEARGGDAESALPGSSYGGGLDGQGDVIMAERFDNPEARRQGSSAQSAEAVPQGPVSAPPTAQEPPASAHSVVLLRQVNQVLHQRSQGPLTEREMRQTHHLLVRGAVTPQDAETVADLALLDRRLKMTWADATLTDNGRATQRIRENRAWFADSENRRHVPYFPPDVVKNFGELALFRDLWSDLQAAGSRLVLKLRQSIEDGGVRGVTEGGMYRILPDTFSARPVDSGAIRRILWVRGLDAQLPEAVTSAFPELVENSDGHGEQRLRYVAESALPGSSYGGGLDGQGDVIMAERFDNPEAQLQGGSARSAEAVPHRPVSATPTAQEPPAAAQYSTIGAVFLLRQVNQVLHQRLEGPLTEGETRQAHYLLVRGGVTSHDAETVADLVLLDREKDMSWINLPNLIRNKNVAQRIRENRAWFADSENRGHVPYFASNIIFGELVHFLDLWRDLQGAGRPRRGFAKLLRQSIEDGGMRSVPDETMYRMPPDTPARPVESGAIRRILWVRGLDAQLPEAVTSALSGPVENSGGHASAGIVVGEVSTPYDAWNAFAAERPEDAAFILAHVRSRTAALGTTADDIQRVYQQLSADHRSEPLATQATRLVHLFVARQPRTGLLDAGARTGWTDDETAGLDSVEAGPV